PIRSPCSCQPTEPTPFPYTTLFRSRKPHRGPHARQRGSHGGRLGDAGPRPDGSGGGGAVRVGDELLPHSRWARTRPSRCRRDSEDRKSTRLNSSHVAISYAVFCLKK